MPITASDGRKISAEVAKQLLTQRQRIMPIAAADRLWMRVLTAQDRKRLGGDLAECYTRLKGTAGMWMKLRGVNYDRAVIEVAHELGFLRDSDKRWLLREIGKGVERSTSPDHPCWEAKTGELRFGNRIVRRVRIMRVPTNIQKILDAFQDSGWPPQINNPLTLGPQQLHQALRSLNYGLKKLRFHASGGGLAIYWERR